MCWTDNYQPAMIDRFGAPRQVKSISACDSVRKQIDDTETQIALISLSSCLDIEIRASKKKIKQLYQPER